MTESGSEIDELLEGFRVVIAFDIAWGDMDAFGHVNNIWFFRYFENARIAYFRCAGLFNDIQEMKVGPILKSTACDYLRPLAFPDHVKLGVRVSKITTHSIVTEYLMVSQAQKAAVAKGTATIVTFDYRSKTKVPVPSTIIEQLENLEGRALI